MLSSTVAVDSIVSRTLNGLVTVEADPKKGDAVYEAFYRTGGWKYVFWREYLWHRKHVVKRFGLTRRMRILEAACGTGFHTNMFRRMGFDCVGIDRSHAGIAWARKHYPKSVYRHRDILDDVPEDRGAFDVVFARGCSHYHYDLSSAKAISTTQHLMDFLKPRGVFVMAIVTDLSGRKEPDRIWQNTLADYRQHFASFGLPWTVDWHRGTAICSIAKA